MERWKSIIQEENEEVSERLELAQQRIAQIPEETTVKEKYQPYFNQCATLVQKVLDVVSRVGNCELRNQSEAWLRQQNIDLYEEIMPKAYETSYANPVYCYKLFGEEGKSLSFLYAQLRSLIPFAFEYRLVPITVTLELLLEIYNIYEEQEDDVIKSVKSAIYYFAHDYCEDFLVARMRETNDPTYSFAYDIIMDSNLNDLSYLYYYGEYIDENERKIAAFLNAMPEEEVKKLADTFTEGYIRGFQVMGADLSKKSIVGIRTCIGFERMMRYAIQNLEKIGKKVVIYRVAYDVITKKYGRKVGYYATSPNLQYEYDHRFDKGLFFDKNMKECMLAGLKNAYEKYKLEVAEYAGPAVLETFGEPDFEPVKHSETISLDERQQQWSTQYSNEASMLSYEYSKAEETSFTIIAFPLPSIGESFEAIFAETVKVNTLDNQTYKEIQQCLIDALDQGEKVVVTGAGDNKTQLEVALIPLTDPTSQTKFENCTADVNIPVGEVFTSPKLSGTNGCLYVSRVFLNGLEYRGLEITFKDGMITSYRCSNFEKEEDNLAYVKENILMNRDTLPLGEFAIGTNTTAYQMGIKYQIQKKLPILIAEKTGPHFAVGDTCYSHSEDHKVYNPDGKEIIARDNEFSLQRKTDIAKAYVNCHTDITIPYNEVKEIAVVTKDNKKIVLIQDGVFVLPGTEVLNEALTK